MAKSETTRKPASKRAPAAAAAGTDAESMAPPRLPATRKGRVKRGHIRKVTSELLREVAYHDLTLELITTRVGMPISVFYHYFPNKRALVLELLDEVFTDFRKTAAKDQPYGTGENGIYKVTAGIFRLYSENQGLMRCLYEVEDPEFALRWREHLSNWHFRIAKGLEEFATSSNDFTELLAIVHALGGMVETFAYERFVAESEPLKAFAPDIETAAAFLTTLWIRAVFLSNPKLIDPGRFPTLMGLSELPLPSPDEP